MKRRLLHLFTIITIEPMLFVQSVAQGISQIATDQMLVYKICRGLLSLTEIQPVFQLCCSRGEIQPECGVLCGYWESHLRTYLHRHWDGGTNSWFSLSSLTLSTGCQLQQHHRYDDQFRPDTSLLLHRQLERPVRSETIPREGSLLVVDIWPDQSPLFSCE